MFKSNFKKSLKIIVVVILLIFLHWIKVLAPVEELLMRAAQPTWQKIYDLSSNWRGQSAAAGVNWEQKTADLQKQVDDLTVANANLQNLQDENAKLRQYLNFFSHTKINYLLASVISQENFLDANRYGQNIVIDKGSQNKLEPGLIVINGDGLVVGKIVAVKDQTAEISLLTNAACKIAVTINNQNRTIGVTTGDLGLSVKLNFVSQTEKVNVGDLVTTSGLESNIPAGLVVGHVSQINNNENDVWQNIDIQPMVNFDNLGVVSVILPN